MTMTLVSQSIAPAYAATCPNAFLCGIVRSLCPLHERGPHSILSVSPFPDLHASDEPFASL